MKWIASRQLAAKPKLVWDLLKKEPSVVVTKGGLPRGIILPTSEETLLEDMQEILFTRARRSLSKARARASRSGKNRMTDAEIQAEIADVRACCAKKHRSS